jgi:hypothetical protein
MFPHPRARNAPAAKAPSRHEAALSVSTLKFSYRLLTAPVLAFRHPPPLPAANDHEPLIAHPGSYDADRCIHRNDHGQPRGRIAAAGKQAAVLAVVITIAKGYDLGYIWKTQDHAADRTTGGYYIDAAQAGEPPGRWWGPGAQALGLTPGQTVQRTPYPKLLNLYATNTVGFCDGNRVALDQSDTAAIFASLSNRIYKTRNALVHSKEGSKAKFVPFTDDRDLIPEVPLMRFIAERIIVATSVIPG